jgi:hypothetical protein
MNLSNREELVDRLKQAAQPSPEAQQQQQMAQELQLRQAQAQIAVLEQQAAESQARAAKYATETQYIPAEAETDRLKVLSTNLQPGEADEREFQQRAKVAELLLKERDLVSKENIVNRQMKESNGN